MQTRTTWLLSPRLATSASGAERSPPTLTRCSRAPCMQTLAHGRRGRAAGADEPCGARRGLESHIDHETRVPGFLSWAGPSTRHPPGSLPGLWLASVASVLQLATLVTRAPGSQVHEVPPRPEPGQGKPPTPDLALVLDKETRGGLGKAPQAPADYFLGCVHLSGPQRLRP